MQHWSDFWPVFIKRERLQDKIAELDALDEVYGKSQSIEEICKSVYEKYDAEDESRLKDVRLEFLRKIDDISYVHLSTSRVKSIDSVLRKIIVKRHESYLNKADLYASLTGDTYQDAITDLVGVRVILSYRGDWRDVHRELVGKFRLRNKAEYSSKLLQHVSGDMFMAEWPKVYHADGDDINSYEEEGLITKVHPKGYRSIHYTISFMDTYIELQVRTIYDEAWSDVDHRYVYKQEANPSNEALKELSAMLCKLTNLANDIGEQMRAVFEGERMSKASENGDWLVTEECKDFFGGVAEELDACKQSFEDMCNRMTSVQSSDE